MSTFLDVVCYGLICTFTVWLAFWVEYNPNQSGWMQFIRKWL